MLHGPECLKISHALQLPHGAGPCSPLARHSPQIENHWLNIFTPFERIWEGMNEDL